MKIILILPNIRSAHNVGAILRSADGAGVSKVYFTGYTPTPVDRFGRKRSDIAKSALSAEDSVPSEYFANTCELISKLKSEGYEIVGLEQNGRSVNYKNYLPSQNVAIVVGNEVDGIDADILDMCDQVLEIKMHGQKESLNVAVATSILLFSLN